MTKATTKRQAASKKVKPPVSQKKIDREHDRRMAAKAHTNEMNRTRILEACRRRNAAMAEELEATRELSDLILTAQDQGIALTEIARWVEVFDPKESTLRKVTRQALEQMTARYGRLPITRRRRRTRDEIEAEAKAAAQVADDEPKCQWCGDQGYVQGSGDNMDIVACTCEAARRNHDEAQPKSNGKAPAPAGINRELFGL